MRASCLAVASALLLAPGTTASGEEPNQSVQVAGGTLTCEAPASWKLIVPKSRILEKEMAIAPPEGVEAAPARLTMMAAGGSVQANLARWIGQFKGTEGGADRSAAETEEVTIDGLPTTLLDISGTYMQSAGGPFGPKTPRPNYRMRAAIVETGESVSYFFKLIGPAETVDPAADDFGSMIKSLRKQR